MPRSRNRQPRNRSAKQRRRSRRQRESHGRALVATLRPGQSLEHLLTDDDHEAMRLAMDAAARGDARAAYEHHMSGLIVEEALVHHRLWEMAGLGDAAPAWMCSRWAVDQALMWMLLGEDPRCDEVVRMVLAALHLREVDQLSDDPVALQEYGTLIAAGDWVYQQLAAYECGGLRDFLDVKAEPGLLDRVDEIAEWERAAVTAYEVLDLHDDVIAVRRMSDDATLDLLNLGAATEVGRGGTVVGRVVPISVWPFFMFESRPLPVDRVTAEDVATRMRGEDDLGWFWALAEAYDDGRLPPRATCGHGTLYSTDLVLERGPSRREDADQQEEAGRMRELMAAGLTWHQANGVCVAEVGLIVAEVSGDIGPIAGHVTSVLIDESVHEALKVHGVGAGRGRWWRVLAAGTPSPVRERCMELAELCEQRAA